MNVASGLLANARMRRGRLRAATRTVKAAAHRFKPGDAFLEPANKKIIGYNNGRERTSVAVFYVSNSNAPFLNRVR